MLAAMAVAALLLSIVALAVSGLSAWFTYRQAAATEKAARYESDRRHDERQPRIEVSHHRRGQERGQHWFRFRNGGPIPLTDLQAELFQHGGDPPLLVGLTLSGGTYLPSERMGPMGVGQHELLLGMRSPTVKGSTVTFLITAYAGEEMWQLVEDVVIPPSGEVHVF